MIMMPDYNYDKRVEAEKIAAKQIRQSVLSEVARNSKVVNAYGDRIIRGCDWQRLNGLDFEGQPIKDVEPCSH